MNNYSTLDRFQGAWLGSIIGLALSNRIERSDYCKILDYEFPVWVEIRNQSAQIALENKPANLVVRQLTEILAKDYSDSSSCARQDDLISSKNGSRLMPKASPNDYSCRVISLLLPLIMAQADTDSLKDIHTEVVAQYCPDLEIAAQTQADITAWNYILTQALNNKFQLGEPNVSMIVKQVLRGVEVTTASLVTNLEIVSQAWENGLSLEQLTQRLYQQENLIQEAVPTASLAIALSLYCFASTPRNFMFSVKRATKIDSILSPQITILTASISGAYNGVSGIPRNWLKAASNHRSYQIAQKTVKELYRTWSGVYRLDNNGLLVHSGVNAIASPQIFQTRQNLKIISQKSSLG